MRLFERRTKRVQGAVPILEWDAPGKPGAVSPWDELGLRRSAALPTVRDSKQRRQSVLENDEMNADPSWDIGKNGGAVEERTRMGHRLAERAVRIVDGERIVRPIALAVTLTVCRRQCRGARVTGQRGDTYQRRKLRHTVMDMSRDDDTLDAKRYEGEKQKERLPQRRQTGSRHIFAPALQCPSGVSVLGHTPRTLRKP